MFDRVSSVFLKQCVAVCCSALQCVAECCRVLQSVAECCSVLQYVYIYIYVCNIHMYVSERFSSVLDLM